MDSQDRENYLFRSFASAIFKDIQKYVSEHQSEYEEWLKIQEKIESN